MPELPEIHKLAQQMQAELAGRTISGVEVLQPKCLNVPEEEFRAALTGAQIRRVSYRGKWLFVESDAGWLLLSLGMGGEVLLVTRETLPEKYRLIFDFADGSALAINFWWFGYLHYVPEGALEEHEMTAKLGPNALELSAGDLQVLLRGRRGRLKNYLLDQAKIAGIGNFYIHDILFRAGLHPLRPANTLDDADVAHLAGAIREVLEFSITKGAAWYEKDLYGEPGGFVQEDLVVGYREGEPCPVCETPIEKIKTGSTSSFVCPRCQKF